MEATPGIHPRPKKTLETVAISLFLAAIVWIVFGQTLGFGFVNYDDQDYVYNNPHITAGLSLRAISWAFTHVHSANWHPLTTISHMLDCQVYGLHPRGHHLTNVILHTAAAIFLFLALRQMTRATWQSAFVAAVFAIHPLRAESVAWISERKDVLSGAFFMLTLLAYGRYVQKPVFRRYFIAIAFFALGLMSKPTLVTLPFVLLLLDWWPLGRMEAETTPGENAWKKMKPLLLEKIPFFALSALSCVATLCAQRSAIVQAAGVSFPSRMSNAAVSYMVYLEQMVNPTGLAALYPRPANHLPAWEILLSILLLVSISTAVFVLRSRRPFLLTGWLWYLGMLVPMIGIVQVGGQAWADRYTYLPQIGIYLMVTWAAADFCARCCRGRFAPGAVAAALLIPLMLCARIQTSYWHDSISLWTHTLAHTKGNSVAGNNLGLAFQQNGRLDEALASYQRVLDADPANVGARNNSGMVLQQQGRLDEAILYYQAAIKINPGYALGHYNLGAALQSKGALDEAIGHYQRAIEIKPDYAAAYTNLGAALARKGLVDDAITQYQKALKIDPLYADADYNLGNALLEKRRLDEAISYFNRTLEIKPDDVQARINLGTTFFQKGDADSAIAQFQKALAADPRNADACFDLGIAFQGKGQPGHAIAWYQKALEIQPDHLQAQLHLGSALFQTGDMDGAIVDFEKALKIDPPNATAHYNLGVALERKGRTGEAIAHYQKALQSKPGYVEVLNNLAYVLATSRNPQLRNGTDAVELAQKANELTGGSNLVVLGTLAAAYAETGRFPEAVKTIQKALDLATAQGNSGMAGDLQEHLKLYQTGQPFRDGP